MFGSMPPPPSSRPGFVGYGRQPDMPPPMRRGYPGMMAPRPGMMPMTPPQRPFGLEMAHAQPVRQSILQAIGQLRGLHGTM